MRTVPSILSGLVLLLAVSASLGQEDSGRGFRSGRDPNELFSRLSNGKEALIRTEISNPWGRQMFDRMAERLGITNGRITREQFIASMQDRQARREGSNSNSPPTTPQGSSEESGKVVEWVNWVEASFRRLDTNGDGVLNYDEMPEELRSERERWDLDQNGLIDLNEYKAYFHARLQPGPGDAGANPGPWLIVAPADALPAEPEDRKPVVYRTGKLPKGLPAWFEQLDQDKDAQIALFEWRASGRPIAEFLQMDRNKDGFLTVEEVLAYQAKHHDDKASNPGSPVHTLSKSDLTP
jgi:Ca2+-binding EF-hand superfamily protein